MRILTLLAAMISIGAGQAWARGGVYINTGTVEGGTLTFYSDASCTGDAITGAIGITVYIKATPDVVHTVTGMTAANFTVVKSGGTNIAQARRRSGSNNPSAGVTITVTQATDGETPISDVFCFTMPDDGANVIVSATFPDIANEENVAYIDKNGAEQTVAKAYILTGSETVLGVSGQTTWYICSTDLTYSTGLTLAGDVNLIIADGSTMTVHSISGDNGDDDYDLAIHGQAPASGDYLPGNCKLISNNGLNDFGKLTVNSGSVSAYGIDASNITINGGQVNSGGPLYASSNITLGWNNANDFIKASSYSGTVSYATGKRFLAYSGDDVSGIASSEYGTSINGTTLRPLDGWCVTAPSSLTLIGKTDPDFTIDSTPYYIYKEDDPVTLEYEGTSLVKVTGTTLSAVEDQAMQRTFTMPAQDVTLTATDVTSLTATTVTYDGNARTPVIKQGDDVFAAANYTIAYKLGNEDVTAANVKDANTYTCTLTGLGQYVGTTSVDFTIDKADYYQPTQIQNMNITKYVPSDKSGSFTIALPALPEGAAYSFTIADEDGVIDSHSYDAEHNTLTFTTNSGKAAETTATITVEAKDAPNYNDYSFTVSAKVSEYTVAYDWDPQTNIYLIGNDWAFCDRDKVERPYHDNELVWAEDGVTLDRSKITISGGTPSDVTYKVDDTVLNDVENKVVLAPGVHRINITGDGLDDWVEFKVIKLIEDENFELTVTGGVGRFVAPEEAADYGLRVEEDGTGLVSIAECNPDMKVTIDGEDVTKNENMTLWYRTSGFNYDDEELYLNDTYRTPVHGMVGFQTTYIVGNEPNSEMCVYNVNLSAPPSASLDGVSRLDVVCGQLVWHREGEVIKKKVDLDDVPVSSGADGGYVYYVGIDCPDFYLKDRKVYYQDKTGEHPANTKDENNKDIVYAITDGKDIFYAGGETIYQYGNFIGFGSCTFDLNDTKPVALCESRKALGDIIGDCQCPKDGDGNCTSCFSQSQDGNTLTVCGETIEMGPYIVVGTNFVLTGNRAIYNIVPGTDSYKIEGANISTTINGSTITIDGKYTINVGNRPIVKGNFWLVPTETIGFYASAYARYQTEDPYCYLIDRCDFKQEIRRSEVSVIALNSEYKVGDEIEFKIATCSYKYPEDKDTYRGSTGDIDIYLNNEQYGDPIRYNDGQRDGYINYHNVDLGDLPAGTYTLRIELDRDMGYEGTTATATFTVVRNDSEVTLTGTTPADEAFETGANIEYDPDNPIVVNAVNDKAVSGTYWTWQLSNTSTAGVVELGTTTNNSGNNAVNSEDISLNTVGLGTVTLKAGFSGNNKYNPAIGSITFTVVPKSVTNPIVELASQEPIYYDGTEKKPAVKVYYEEDKEIPAGQYTVTYQNNTNASTEDSKAKIIVKSKTGALYTFDTSSTPTEFVIQQAIVTVTELPTASAIADGQTLAASTLTGGAAKAGELDVEGTFAWKDATVVPTLADSEVTEYDVTFTPNSANFEDQECKVKLKVVQPVTLFAENSTNLWATFCDSYERTLPEGCSAYTISSVSGTTVTLSTALTTTIPAYTPVLVYRETAGADAVEAAFKAEGTAPTDGYDSETGLASTTGTDWTFYGNASNTKFTDDGETQYLHTIEEYDGTQSYVLRGGLFLKVGKDEGIAAHRCWLNVTTTTTSNARQLSIEKMTTNSLTSLTPNPSSLTPNPSSLTPNPSPKGEGSSQGWYSLDGRRLDGVPTAKGVYIHNGVKTVIK